MVDGVIACQWGGSSLSKSIILYLIQPQRSFRALRQIFKNCQFFLKISLKSSPTATLRIFSPREFDLISSGQLGTITLRDGYTR